MPDDADNEIERKASDTYGRKLRDEAALHAESGTFGEPAREQL